MRLSLNKLLCVSFLIMLAVLGSVALVSNLRLRAGMVKHAFFCSCCRHEGFSKEWSKLSRFLEQNIGESVLCNDELVTLNGAFHRLLGRKTIFDVAYQYIIKSDKGWLWHPVPDGRLLQGENTDNLVTLRNHLKEGTKFLVVIAPDKSVSHEVPSLPGISTYSTRNMEVFFEECKQKGISYLDLREWVNQEEMFFKTDHHWKIGTAFLAFERIIDWLSHNGLSECAHVPAVVISNYAVVKQKSSFLGSTGRRTGALFAGLDDFEILQPSFITKMALSTCISKGEMIERAGTFKEIVVRQEYLNSPDITCNRYASYFGQDDAKTVILNSLVKKGDVLLIKDSFGLPVSAFLSLAVARMTMIDIRLYGKFESLVNYVRQNNHDFVILLYNADMLTTPEMFDFENGPDNLNGR